MRSIAKNLLYIVGIVCLLFLCVLMFVACGDVSISSLTIDIDDSSYTYDAGSKTIKFAYGELDNKLETLLASITVTAHYDDSSEVAIIDGDDYKFSTDIVKPTTGNIAPGSYYIQYTYGGKRVKINIIVASTIVSVPQLSLDTINVDEGGVINLEYNKDGYDLLDLGIFDNISDKITIGGDTSATEVGEYTITFACADRNYSWSDGTNGTVTKTVTWKIVPKAVSVPQFTTLFYEYNHDNNYNGIATSLIVPSTFDNDVLTISGDLNATDAGVYNAVVSLKDSHNYVFADGTITNIRWYITKKTLAVPTLTSNHVSYCSYVEPLAQSPYINLDSNYIEEIMNFNTGITDTEGLIGKHTATIEIDSNYRNNFQFDDNVYVETLNWYLDNGSYVDANGNSLWTLPNNYVIATDNNGKDIEFGAVMGDIIDTVKLCNAWKDVSKQNLVGEYIFDSNAKLSYSSDLGNASGSRIINVNITFRHGSGYYNDITVSVPVLVHNITIDISPAWITSASMVYDGTAKSVTDSVECDKISSIEYSYIYCDEATGEYTPLGASEIIDAGTYRATAHYVYDKDKYRLCIGGEYSDYSTYNFVISKQVVDVNDADIISVANNNTTYNGRYQGCSISLNPKYSQDFDIVTKYYAFDNLITNTLSNPSGLPKDVLLDIDGNVVSYSVIVEIDASKSNNYVLLNNNKILVNGGFTISKAVVVFDDFITLPEIIIYQLQNTDNLTVPRCDFRGVNEEIVDDAEFEIVSIDNIALDDDGVEVIFNIVSNNYEGLISVMAEIRPLTTSITYNNTKFSFQDLCNMEEIAVGDELLVTTSQGLKLYLDGVEIDTICLDNANTEVTLTIAIDEKNVIFTKTLNVFNRNIIPSIIITDGERSMSYNINAMYENELDNAVVYRYDYLSRSVTITFDSNIAEKYQLYLSIDNSDNILLEDGKITIKDVRLCDHIEVTYTQDSRTMSALMLYFEEITAINIVSATYKNLTDGTIDNLVLARNIAVNEYNFAINNAYVQAILVELNDTQYSYIISCKDDVEWDVKDQSMSQNLVIKVYDCNNACVEIRTIALTYNFAYSKSKIRNNYNYITTITGVVSNNVAYQGVDCTIEGELMYTLSESGLYSLDMSLTDGEYIIHDSVVVNYVCDISKYISYQDTVDAKNRYFSDFAMYCVCADDYVITIECSDMYGDCNFLRCDNCGFDFVSDITEDNVEDYLAGDSVQYSGDWTITGYRLIETDCKYLHLQLTNSNTGEEEYVVLYLGETSTYTEMLSSFISYNGDSYYLTKSSDGVYNYVSWASSKILKLNDITTNMNIVNIANSDYTIQSSRVVNVGGAVAVEITACKNSETCNIFILVD